MPSNKPILINDTITSTEEFYAALASSLRLPNNEHLPVPRNLDHLADFIKEARISKIICSRWHVPIAETQKILQVFHDLGVSLIR